MQITHPLCLALITVPQARNSGMGRDYADAEDGKNDNVRREKGTLDL